MRNVLSLIGGYSHASVPVIPPPQYDRIEPPLTKSAMRVGVVRATAGVSRTLRQRGYCSRLFCTAGNFSRDGAALLVQPDEEHSFSHSNPRIQVLLDRYKNLCEMQPPPGKDTGAPLSDRNDSQSPTRAVFSNNLVDLSRVDVVGFDYDYTLATCECYQLCVSFAPCARS